LATMTRPGKPSGSGVEMIPQPGAAPSAEWWITRRRTSRRVGPRHVVGQELQLLCSVIWLTIKIAGCPPWTTRNNLHPSCTAKLPKNLGSWRINPTYQTFKQTCENSPRALNGWRLITTPKADGVRLGDREKGSERHRYPECGRLSRVEHCISQPCSTTKSSIGSV
jgi:hypothetical protein